MSQLFDYFVCPRSTIEKWVDALEQQDEELQHNIESQMQRLLTLRNIGQDEFIILAGCVESGELDTVNAVGQIDLVKSISEEEGPWIMSFRRATVEAIANLSLDMNVVDRWGKAVAELHGNNEDYYREVLTADAAKSLKELCSVAIEKRLDLFTCFYG